MNTDSLTIPLATPEDLLPPRLDSLDLLRGVAVLGILLMNTQSMSMPSTAYYNPTDYGDLTGWNYPLWIVVHILADMKFITTFSILFGAGIILQADRMSSRGLAPARIHYSRMVLLLLLGLLHAYLLWFGDILVPYAVCGMLLFPLRRLPSAVLIFGGVCAIATASFAVYCRYANIVDPVLRLGHLSDHLTVRVCEFNFQLASYRGGWMGQMENRSRLALDNQTTTFLLWTGWRCGGAILIGMGLLRLRFFHGEWASGAYTFLAALMIPIGWCITGLGVLYNMANYWDWNVLAFPGTQFNYWGSLLTTIGYLAAGVLIVRRADHSEWLARSIAPLHAVGKMALSNYIMQSILCTTIFYGHGFGLYGSVSRVQLLGITLVIWIFQIALSTIWLKVFSQGPLEWLWHRLVYGSIRNNVS